ncbi:glucosamine-6-phosphate deaminase [Crassaminicella profunda]|uniref:glucosamine-6-phosphate deaminase n=1 Tax=Crassaminicella profunda TaxID=1286698 RepID=UPI001CA6F48D|nr:glucosamine-6-phosphate deaminase [Crassaminicella profunda]QZY55797.1 glucosamine-6-phosphate deaminase [Crassaminicella profunda]
MKVIMAESYEDMSRRVAEIIASQISCKPKSVLGFATGSTPCGSYGELIRMYNEGKISFEDIIAFNLDEYCGLDGNDMESYHYFMKKNLFEFVNIQEKNIHIPNGRCKDIENECINYEKKIEEAGSIDLQLLGIGENGHIGFNEPDVKFEAHTHLVTLEEKTLKANSKFFNSYEEVPKTAISMGIKTIMNAKKILLLGSGEKKAEVLNKMIYGEITPNLPASILQLHSDVSIIVDKEAGKLLKKQV